MIRKLLFSSGFFILAMAVLTVLFLFNEAPSFQETDNQPSEYFLQRMMQANASNSTNSSKPLNTTVQERTIDLKSLKSYVEGNVGNLLKNTSLRLDTHIFTDKVEYKPSDVMFVEVLVVDAFTKIPIALTTKDKNNKNYYLTFEVEDLQGRKLFTTNNYVSNATATFTYKIPSNITGGEYNIKVSNLMMTPAQKSIRIKSNSKSDQPSDISVQLNQQIYKPGDTVSGMIILGMEEEPRNMSMNISKPTYSYIVNFNTTKAQAQNQSLSNGRGFFTFVIPKNVTLPQAQISFVVNKGNRTEFHEAPLSIVQDDQIRIDFFLETGYLVPSVANKVYFQAFSSEKEDTRDFKNASLKMMSLATKNKPADITLLNNTIKTLHHGKGSFVFTPVLGWQPYLEINNRDNSIQKINITFRQNQNFTKSTNEVSFTILNRNKVLDNEDHLVAFFNTNSLVNSSSFYVFQIKQKEAILYQQNLKFNQSSNLTIHVNSTNFTLINGGVLTANLYKVNEGVLITYESTNVTNNRTNATSNSTKSNSTNNTNTTIIQIRNQTIYDLEPRGEIMFFKKPSETLDIIIKTDKTEYAVGDTVTYEINVINKKTKKVVSDRDTLISVIVTDESVFSEVDRKNQPPSLAAALYLENEVMRHHFEFDYANEYVNHWFMNTNMSSDMNLELLLGVQEWRQGAFDYDSIRDVSKKVNNMTEDKQYAASQLYSFQFINYTNNATNATNGTRGQNGTNSTNGTNTTNGTAPRGQNGTNTTNNTGNNQQGQQNNNQNNMGQQMGGQQQQGGNGKDGKDGKDDNERMQNATDYMTGITQNTKLWAHSLRSGYSKVSRVDFTETQLFASAQRSKNGTLKGSFKLSDLTTKFRITAQSIDVKGKIGQNQSSIQTQKPLYIKYDFPEVMTAGEIIKVNVTIVNLNTFKMTTYFYNDMTNTGLSYTLPKAAQTLNAKSSKSQIINVTAQNVTDMAFLNMGIYGVYNKLNYNDSRRAPVRVIPRGVPRVFTEAGYIGSRVKSTATPSNASFMVHIPKTIEQGTEEFSLTIFSSNFAQLLEAIESLLEEPHGSYEQTAAIVYPMVIALQFVNAQTVQTDYTKGLKIRLQNKLQEGYDRLLHFQTQENGFEWFGKSPANEALSAYALMQFTEMAKVTSFVDTTMVNTLKTWILSRKNGKGSFNKNSQQIAYFGNAPDNVTDAYIVWALTSAGVTNINTEFTALQKVANATMKNGTSDPYILSLLASTCYNLKKTALGNYYADKVKTFQQKDGFVNKSLTTITNSDGINKDIETTAMATIAWLQNSAKYSANILSATNWLTTQVAKGKYGSSQGTVLALKALTTYQKTFAYFNGNGTFVLRVNDTVIRRINFTQDQKEAITFDLRQEMMNKPQNGSQNVSQNNSGSRPNMTNATQFIIPGAHLNVSVALENFTLGTNQKTDFKVQYAFAYRYYDSKIEQSNSPMNMNQNMTQQNSTMNRTNSTQNSSMGNNTSRNQTNNTGNNNMSMPQNGSSQMMMQPVLHYNVIQAFSSSLLGMTNMTGKQFTYILNLFNPKKNSALGMTIAKFRKPTCLDFKKDSLEDMKKMGIIDFFEVNHKDEEIVFYWRQVRPMETKFIKVDLIQSYSGVCVLRPHTAYPYYNDDQAVWSLAQPL